MTRVTRFRSLSRERRLEGAVGLALGVMAQCGMCVCRGGGSNGETGIIVGHNKNKKGE